MNSSVRPLLDIAIVVFVSGAAWLLQETAVTRGWVALPPDAGGVLSVLAAAITAVWLVRMRGGTFADLGFKRPASWLRVAWQVPTILAVFILAQNLVPPVLGMFVELPAPDFSRHADIAGNLPAAILLALMLPVTAAIPEEVIYRGFLIERLSDLFGRDPMGAVVAVFVQSLVFGSIHFAWGVGGMLMTALMGLVWGTAYLWCDRNLWVVILAHSAGHILFVVQLYLADTFMF